MKKTKQPGDNISLKTKKTEDPAVMNWLNAQTNLMDSLRYLIENEILQNGVRNLQMYIPMERNAFAAVPASPVQAATNNQHEVLDRESPAVLAAAKGEIAAAGAEPAPSSVTQPTAGMTAAMTPEPAEARIEPPEPAESDDEIDDDDIEAWI
ncbi:hypothetical protein [Paenibacillus piri]|uniref:hypothetical protein n=1 Tax=Paenibacillus piri TaxID=2547395 RepID=UPI001FE83787|nr:hypothetical protein [Paenibacillus piri]